MGGELNVGDKFGTYSGMVNHFSEKYNAIPQEIKDEEKLQSKYSFYDKETGGIKANGCKEKIRYTDYNTPMYANATIFDKGFTYGTSAKDEKGLDTFDYILGKNQFALDYDGDGEVDSDEILEGKIDMFSYRKAKDSGDLRNYLKFLEQYKNK